MTDDPPPQRRKRIDPYSPEAFAKLSQAKREKLLRDLGAIDPHSLLRAEINPDDPTHYPTEGIAAGNVDQFILSVQARFSSRLRAAPPKYQDPARPYLTWRGAGSMPRWLRESIEVGSKLEDFLTRKD